MSQNIRSIPLGSVYYQSGNGYPTHIATKGCTYIDVNTGIEYINKDGLINWVSFLDGSMVITGTTTPTFQQVMETGNSYGQIIGNFTYTLQFDEGSSTFVCYISNNTTNETSLISLSSLISYVLTTNSTFTSGNINDLSEGATLTTSKVVEGVNKIVVPYRTSGANTDIAIFVPPNNKPTGTYTLAILEDIPPPITIDTTPTDGSSNAVSSNGVFDALALTPKIIIRNITPSSVLSGTTSETQISSFNFTISANTFSATDILKIETLAWEKSGTTNASTCRLKLSNTNNYATASNVLILAASANNINMRGTRTYKIAGGNLKGLMSASANGIFNDNTLTNLAVSTLALDVTQPIYGFVSLNNTSSADATIVNELIITKW
jgi:hypothetical protein